MGRAPHVGDARKSPLPLPGWWFLPGQRIPTPVSHSVIKALLLIAVAVKDRSSGPIAAGCSTTSSEVCLWIVRRPHPRTTAQGMLTRWRTANLLCSQNILQTSSRADARWVYSPQLNLRGQGASIHRCPERVKSVPRTPDPQMAFPQANAGALGAAGTCPFFV